MWSAWRRWPDCTVRVAPRRFMQETGFSPTHFVIMRRTGRISESCKRAIRGGFAAMTPQQSGAATTSASVIGMPCSRVTPPSPRLWRTRPPSPSLCRTRLLTCSYPPHALLRFCNFRAPCRTIRAKDLLQESGISIGEVAEALGYLDVFFFSRQFKPLVGLSPAKFREKSKHENQWNAVWDH